MRASQHPWPTEPGSATYGHDAAHGRIAGSPACGREASRCAVGLWEAGPREALGSHCDRFSELQAWILRSSRRGRPPLSLVRACSRCRTTPRWRALRRRRVKNVRRPPRRMGVATHGSSSPMSPSRLSDGVRVARPSTFGRFDQTPTFKGSSLARCLSMPRPGSGHDVRARTPSVMRAGTVVPRSATRRWSVQLPPETERRQPYRGVSALTGPVSGKRPVSVR